MKTNLFNYMYVCLNLSFFIQLCEDDMNRRPKTANIDMKSRYGKFSYCQQFFLTKSELSLSQLKTVVNGTGSQNGSVNVTRCPGEKWWPDWPSKTSLLLLHSSVFTVFSNFSGVFINLKRWAPGYTSGVHFQKCSNLSHIKKIYTKN